MEQEGPSRHVATDEMLIFILACRCWLLFVVRWSVVGGRWSVVGGCFSRFSLSGHCFPLLGDRFTLADEGIKSLCPSLRLQMARCRMEDAFNACVLDITSGSRVIPLVPKSHGTLIPLASCHLMSGLKCRLKRTLGAFNLVNGE